MKNLIILALFASASLFAQNPLPFNGAIAVSNGAPAGSFSINANGDVQIGTSNGLDLFQLGSGNYVIGNNLASSAGNFKYLATGVADAIQFAAGDIYLRTFVSGTGGAVALPRTAILIKNGAPDGSVLLDASGNITIPAIKSLTGTRYVCVDTAGKLVSSATACSGT